MTFTVFQESEEMFSYEGRQSFTFQKPPKERLIFIPTNRQLLGAATKTHQHLFHQASDKPHKLSRTGFDAVRSQRGLTEVQLHHKGENEAECEFKRGRH